MAAILSGPTLHDAPMIANSYIRVRRPPARAGRWLLAPSLLLACTLACQVRARPGVAAPEFTVTTAQGAVRRLSDYRGQVLVLNFWATWCPPCVEEVPSLNLLQGRLQGTPVSLLAISVDVDADAYQRFLQAYGIRFPTARDGAATIAKRYGTVRYPETYIVAPDGRVARKIVGPTDWNNPEMVRYLRDLAR